MMLNNKLDSYHYTCKPSIPDYFPKAETFNFFSPNSACVFSEEMSIIIIFLKTSL